MLKSSLFLGRWGRLQRSGWVGLIPQPWMDGDGPPGSERRRALFLGKRRGTYLSVIPKIPDYAGALLSSTHVFVPSLVV